jgi:hypothetical protein
VLALAGILFASFLVILLFLRDHPKDPLLISGLLFTALVFALGTDLIWIDVNAYARIWSPLLILVALAAIARQTGGVFPWRLGLASTFVVDLRLSMQFNSQIHGVIRGLLHI